MWKVLTDREVPHQHVKHLAFTRVKSVKSLFEVKGVKCLFGFLLLVSDSYVADVEAYVLFYRSDFLSVVVRQFVTYFTLDGNQ